MLRRSLRPPTRRLLSSAYSPSNVRLPSTPPPTLLLGDARLRHRSAECCLDAADSDSKRWLQKVEAELHAALARFRAENGYGRAMSAPQINRHMRMIACDLGQNAVHRPDQQPFTLCNPIIMDQSEETFSLWDDCMSFPDLMVRLRRFESVSLKYWDVDGNEFEWRDLRRQEAELLQHEMDHLDGVLAVDRAVDGGKDVVPRAEYLAERERFDRMVDYVIVPTV